MNPYYSDVTVVAISLHDANLAYILGAQQTRKFLIKGIITIHEHAIAEKWQCKLFPNPKVSLPFYHFDVLCTVVESEQFERVK